MKRAWITAVLLVLIGTALRAGYAQIPLIPLLALSRVQPTITISSVALSNSTFTANVANGVVGTVSVTMSDASTFAGSLSITGANSGGFHFSGNTLQESSSGGTAAGTYTDVTIVATQGGATRQIQPTLTGSAVVAGSCDSAYMTARLSGRSDLQNCALNMTFGDSKYANQSNWLAAYGDNSTKEWYQERNCGIGPIPPSAPANIAQVYDGAAGGNVLRLHFNASDFYDNPAGGACDRQIMSIVQQKSDGSASTNWPPNNYLEVVTRLDLPNPGCPSATFDGNGNCQGGWEVAAHWSWSTTATQNGSGNAYEHDFANYFYEAPSGAGMLSQTVAWGNQTDYRPSYGFHIPDASVYHVWGARTTSDGSSIWTCYYDNGTKIGCNSENTATFNGTGFDPFAGRSKLNLQVGPTRYDVNYYIQYIRMWSCASWQSSQCNGSVLTN